MAATNLAIKKRILVLLGIFTFLSIALMVRTGWLQIHDGGKLKKEAIEQQTRDRVINSKRGTIYDSQGKPLAVSASVETVSVTPSEINNAKNANEVATKLSQILGLQYDDVYKKITNNSSYEIIKRKVEKEQADEIRKCNFEGVNLDEDSKRYYPQGDLAAHVIGFTGTDNQGLNGIEIMFDKYLKGAPGRIVSAKNAMGTEMPYKYERYINAEDGDNVVLTLDETIQHFAENHLKTAVIENKIANGAAAIIMDPRTGDILAMAVNPSFDLNQPFEIQNEVEKKELEGLTGDAAKEKYNEDLQKMWRNKAVVDTYEPGSTFKIITSAIALEENVVKLDDQFVCTGAKQVGGFNIHCWKTSGHGPENFVQGVQNSCNPVFMEVGARVGPENFLRYVKAFGLRDKTGIDLPGEAIGPFFTSQNFHEVEVATTSFGQGFQITPIQLITAVSAVANDGKLLKPRLVKQITDKDGNVVKSFEPEVVRQVLSKETDETLRGILESVVSEGSGSNAYIKGFRVAGKTGTSEKLPRGSGKNIASFVGFAPANDPKVACIVMLDEPTGDQFFGGVIAAPVVGKILEDTLRYLNVEPQYTDKDLATMDVSVPEVRNVEIKQAEKSITDAKLKFKVQGTGNTVVDQTPKPGAKLSEQSTVILYTEGAAPAANVTVPDVLKKSVLEANQILTNASLNLKVEGVAAVNRPDGVIFAATQEPAAGTVVSPGTVVTVEFRSLEVD